jgi:cell division protein FtsA
VVGAFDGGKLSIVGQAERPSVGVCKGTIVDSDGAKKCISHAILAAELSAGTRIDSVFLAQSGGHIDGFLGEASVDVSTPSNKVSWLDIDSVCRLAMARDIPEGLSAIHHLRRPFLLDGKAVVNPELQSGHKLEVGYWTVFGSTRNISATTQILNDLGLKVADLVLSGLAAGAMVTTMEERQGGALIFDIGSGTTDYALYRDGCAYLAGVLPVGGSHLTNDLSLGLRLTVAQSETLKLRFGRCTVTTSEKADPVWLNSDLSMGAHPFPLQAIEGIISARAREIFEVVKARLGAAFAAEHTAAGIVITGGTSKLPGIADVATEVFGVPARLGQPPSSVIESLRDPSYSTVLGLFHYEMPENPRHC